MVREYRLYLELTRLRAVTIGLALKASSAKNPQLDAYWMKHYWKLVKLTHDFETGR